MPESLKQQTAKGLFWGAMNSGTTQVLNLVFGIFLARLLSPGEYGIVGVLAIFTAIAGDLQSAGFTQALINLKKPEARDYNSVFTFNVAMSLLMYATLFFSAPLIAEFFHQPCLVAVSRVVFLAIFISSVSIVHGGYLAKHMMNKEIALVGAVALICSGTVGITLALLHFSYWALAWQQVTYVSVVTVGRYLCVKDWHPRLTHDMKPVRSMAPFALKILVTKIINTTSNNILTVIFGRMFTIGQVGNYSQAFKWSNMASSLVSNTVGQIAQPVLVEAQGRNDDSPETSQLRVYRKMIRFTCFLAMPLMLGLSLVSREFINVTLGSKWNDCVPLLQVLCISGAFLPIYTMYQNLSMSQGRSDIYMWLNILQVVLQIAVILAFGTSGMFTMVCAYTAFLILWLLPWHVFVGRLIGYKWRDMMLDVMPFTLIAIAVMLSVWLLVDVATASVWTHLGMFAMHVSFIVKIILAASAYYVVMKLLHVQILKECETFILYKLTHKQTNL